MVEMNSSVLTSPSNRSMVLDVLKYLDPDRTVPILDHNPPSSLVFWERIDELATIFCSMGIKSLQNVLL